MAVNRASINFYVPRRTLQRYLHEEKHEKSSLKRKTILTSAQNVELPSTKFFEVACISLLLPIIFLPRFVKQMKRQVVSGYVAFQLGILNSAIEKLRTLIWQELRR